MAKFKKIVVTESGLGLLTQALSEQKELIITMAQAGLGTYGADESVTQATALKEMRQSFQVNSVSRVDATTLKVKVVMKNVGLSEGYMISEIGLFGKIDQNGPETLIGISIAKEGAYMPEQSTPSQILIEIYLKFSQSHAPINISLNEPSEVYAIASDLIEIRDSFTRILDINLQANAWSGASAPFSQTVRVPGIRVTDKPILVSKLQDGADMATAKAYNKAFACITSGTGTTADGSVTFKVYKKPTIDITVGLKGV